VIYLVLSILISSLLFVIFKYFDVFKIDTLKAIVVNYIVALVLGFTLTENEVSISSLSNQPWIFGALALGMLFLSIFFVMALTAQRNGVSVVSVAGKMSVVVPILFGVYFYNESLGVFKVIGIVIALVAVYLASVKEDDNKHEKAGLLLPIILFIGSGTIDTALKYIQNKYVAENDVEVFSGSLFGFAAFFGLIVLMIKTIKKPEAFGLRNIVAGVLLGVPNYYSIVFLIKALQTKGFESSTLFTINNVSIVIVSTLAGLLIFKEKFSLKNKIGILLAIIGIVLVAIA